MIVEEPRSLKHYGILRRSGRYPWGSGGSVNARSKSFFDYVAQMRAEGLTDTQIAKGVGMTTTEFRATNSIAKNAKKQADIAMVQRLADKGLSNVAIGERMGINESSVRALRAPGEKDKADILKATADMLRRQVDEKRFVDVGSGVENHIGVSTTRLNTAIAMLKAEGYQVHPVKILQQGTGKLTQMRVLTPPDVTQKEAWLNRNNIRQISEYSETGGRSFLGLLPPLSISSKRVAVRYKEEGGDDADGVIYVRPGVKDLSLDGARYAQVRIAVDGTHYLKGMAMYKDDLPAGVDLMFNTNKSSTGNKLDAMKKMKDDPDNPFGSVVRQIGDKDERGNLKKVTSAMNIVNEAGDWDNWSKSLSTQMLSKQNHVLAQTQLDKAYAAKKKDFDEIMALTNPAVKRRLLESFADDADSSAVHMKAASLPRQGTHVILPINSLKPTEIYAPNFNNGERVVLIRYPHGGTFEIPELVVNNKHVKAKKILGDAKDAVGINAEVAKRLSGADFDGDTVLVIPNNSGKIKSTPALKGLEGFDPQSAYPKYPGMKPMSSRTKQTEMGVVSNLITDMTIRGAAPHEIAAAVRHSMVVIDAEKHELNYRQSAIDNNIASLKAKYQTPYQPSGRAGASTLISRAGAKVDVPERKLRSARDGGPIDPATGKLVWEYSGAMKTKTTVSKRTGEVVEKQVPKTVKVKKLAYTDDARTLSSGTRMEQIYAEHSNRLKALANEARRNLVATPPQKYNPSAAKAYSKEVASLNGKLNLALRNRPLERQAQVLANVTISAKKAANKDMDEAELKKLKSMALKEARTRTGAQRVEIEITPSEWEAIQAGAISHHKLSQILAKSNLETVKELATPRPKLLMTSAKVARAQAMLAGGATQAEVAAALGVSLTTLKDSLKS